MAMRDRASDHQQISRRFLEIARDPGILAGVHHSCDEWCDHCPMRDRCLRFRCTTEFRRLRRRRPAEPTFRTAEEALEFARALAVVDEQPASRTFTRGIATRRPGEPDDQALVDIAIEYMTRSRTFVAARGADAATSTPPAAEAILRFHSRIYVKTMRAVVGSQLATIGLTDRCAEAGRCAAQALACIDRSRGGLAQWPDSGERRALAALLDAIAGGLDARFPDARAFCRADVHAAENKGPPRLKRSEN
jgi:hypothetical protein